MRRARHGRELDGQQGGSARAANAPIGTPLEITDETITVMPPNEALKAGKGRAPD